MSSFLLSIMMPVEKRSYYIHNKLAWLSLVRQISCLGVDLDGRRGWGKREREKERFTELCMKCLTVRFNIT